MPPRSGSHRRRRAGAMEPNLTPLLDVVLQLITFFMMLIHFGSQVEGAARGVRLPIAPAALPTGTLALERLVLAIDPEGNLLTPDGQARDPAAAEPWWREQAERRRPPGASDAELPTVVLIRADRDTPYGAVRRALATAQAHGFVHFSLVVEREVAP